LTSINVPYIIHTLCSKGDVVLAEKDSLKQRIRDGLLFDAYGSLLTEKQRLACDMIWLQDLSLAEAAETLNVSRQGVHDLITRARENMEEYESSLALLSRQEKIEKMQQLLEENKTKIPADVYKAFAELIEA
jgi:predicted DNA-binding protein YlxM (UPF0122 family)